MSSGSIVASPVSGSGLVGGVTPTSFICSMDLFTWLPILRVRPSYYAISSVVGINALALVLGLTILYMCPFIASARHVGDPCCASRTLLPVDTLPCRAGQSLLPLFLVLVLLVA